MAVRTSKKKSPPVFSHEFVRKNYGDITCIAFIVLFGGSLLQATSKFMNPLSRFVYTIKNEDDSIRYGNGVWDLVLVLTYSLLCTVMTCLINENICDKFIPRLQLSLKKAFELRYNITYSLFYLFTTVVVALMWKDAVQIDENFTFKSHLMSLIKLHPEVYVSFYVKVFYTIALSFCVSMLMNIYFWNIKPKYYMSVILDNGASFLIYYLMQYFNCGTLGVYLIATFTIPRLFWSLKYISDEFGGKTSYPIRLAFSLLHMVIATAGLTLSWMFTSFLVRITKFTSFQDRTMATSGAYVIFILMSTFVTLNNLKETCGVVFKPQISKEHPSNTNSSRKTRSQPTNTGKANDSKSSSTPKKRSNKK